MVIGNEPERVAIRGRPHNGLRANDAARPGLIVHHHRAAIERLAQRLAGAARNRVNARADAKRQDEAHRMRVRHGEVAAHTEP